jgi:exopolysaccharide biosynthesis polyprenyl glycosylphosphotransferase
MDPILKLKQTALMVGDIILLYISLGFTLFIRYPELTDQIINLHATPFTIIFIGWILIFYISGLYDIRMLKNNFEFSKRLSVAGVTSALLTILIFYLVPAFGIAPKVNLFIFLIIFGLAEYLWRGFYNSLLAAGSPPNRILLVGTNNTTELVAKQIKKNPQLGYEITFWMKDGLKDKEWKHISQIILGHNINLIVVPAHIKKDSRAARGIYKNLALGIEVINLADLYEIIFRKVPLAELEEVWFLENLAQRHRAYEALKRPIELLLSIALLPILLPIMVLVGLLNLIASGSPVIYKQKRIGQHEHDFMLYKFRTMHKDAEATGPQWSKADDKRVTSFGKFLRATHLDEIPQILNILKGELSLVGPRPERPEFVENLEKEIPYYELRHLVRPGITGWAQVNFRYGWSTKDAAEKLQYDMYYIKNRSITLDLLIILRTIKTFFTAPKE